MTSPRPALLLAAATFTLGLLCSACAGNAPALPPADDAGDGLDTDDTARDTGIKEPSDTAPDAPDPRDMGQGGDDTEDAGGDPTPDTAPDDVPAPVDAEDDGMVDEDVTTCPLGEPCNPIPIPTLPWQDRRDTRQATSDTWDAYACSPDTNESGPELVYVLDLTQRGVLTATIDEVEGDGIDVDVHLLDALDPDACLDRGHAGASALLDPGRYFIVIDTWVNGQGQGMPGPYTLDVEFAPVATGRCATTAMDLEMVWSSCDPGLDCFEQGGKRYLRTPAIGPVVKEAHLVTVEEDFPATWPSSSRDQIARHYALSAQTTGYVMSRTEAWAPAGEGGSMYGQGSTGRKVPVEEEAWYVNMYWRQRPAAGTRMIITNPANGRAVVAAAGYETGPGANTAIGGVTEEIHDYLGTSHRGTLMLGFAEDQTLPYGPIDCE